MNKKEKLEKLIAENEYYEVDFLEKQKLNKIIFARKIFDDFILYFDNVESSVNRTDNKIEIFTIPNTVTINLLTDIENKPKQSLIFQLSKIDNETKNRLDFVMMPNNISALPKPDFNKLFESPYKGMDLLEIEILEQQKNIEFLKKYINDTFNFYDYNFYCQSQISKKPLGEFDTIAQMMKEIV